MINLQPLIEKFKKAVYGRDVRQSIVDLAQAIGDNHNEQEELRNEVKSLNADTKEENRQGKEYITNKKAEMDEAITACKKSIDGKVNIGIQKLETKISQGKQELLDKTESEISSLEQKTTESTQTIEAAISRASKSKAAIDTVISVAGDSKTALYETIQESKSSKTNLDSTIQQSTAKDQELENHITEINKIIADGKAVTKDELSEELKNKLSNYPTLEQVKPEIIAINCGGFMWYVQIEPITFINAPDTTEKIKTRRIKAYCYFRLYNFKDKVKRDENNPGQASLEVLGWLDNSSTRGIGFARTFDRYASFEIRGPEAKSIIWKELLPGQFSLQLNWNMQNSEAKENRLYFIIKAETFI